MQPPPLTLYLEVVLLQMFEPPCQLPFHSRFLVGHSCKKYLSLNPTASDIELTERSQLNSLNTKKEPNDHGFTDERFCTSLDILYQQQCIPTEYNLKYPELSQLMSLPAKDIVHTFITIFL